MDNPTTPTPPTSTPPTHRPIILLALGFTLTFLLVRALYLHHLSRRHLLSLGHHAPYIHTRFPLGLDFILHAVQRVRRHENLEFWQEFLARSANPARPFTVEAWSVGQRVVLTVDEENIKAILAAQFADYGKGERFRREWRDFLGESIFTTDGAQWHDSRQLLRPQFIKDRVSDLHVFEKHVQTLIPMLDGARGGKDVPVPVPVNVVNLFFRYTLDAATDFLLGRSVCSMENPEVRFIDAFAEVQRVQGLVARAGPLNPLIPRKTLHAGLKVVNEFIRPFIEEALRLPQAELEKKSSSDEGYTFLHALASFTRDPQVLRDQLTAVLLAGRDTTACTLSWLFYEISKNPRIVETIRREIAGHVGMERAPTYADLKSMRYLQHTINETLRLYPVLPFNVRVALRDTTLPHGGGADGKQPIGVRAGDPIGYSTLGMQRRADIYPPESDKFPHHLTFAPERWDHWTPKPWTYIPFNGGPRICIGQQFALTEIAYTTVRILQTYSRIENRNSGHPGLKTDIVLQPADGVDVVFWKAARHEQV